MHQIHYHNCYILTVVYPNLNSLLSIYKNKALHILSLVNIMLSYSVLSIVFISKSVKSIFILAFYILRIFLWICVIDSEIMSFFNQVNQSKLKWMKKIKTIPDLTTLASNSVKSVIICYTRKRMFQINDYCMLVGTVGSANHPRKVVCM